MLEAIFVKPFANILFLLYNYIPGHDFGIAVILVTAAIRLALWPILARQLHSQRKLQALQPEIAKLKEQAAGDRQKESQMLMELYKEKEINPLASCLPLLIQFPFLIGLFVVFSKSSAGMAGFEGYLYEPIKNLSFIKEVLAQPVLFQAKLFGIVDLASSQNIILAILAGASQYFQVKQITPKQVDPNDPTAAANRMMMYMFPLLTGWIGYTTVAALPLYWAVSNGVSILQQTLTASEEIEKMEEAQVVTKVRSSSDREKTTKKKRKGGKK
ncbi:membrane protein insertase YidC [bacterium]|nr:membrane protein insertase YidC [bacterium]